MRTNWKFHTRRQVTIAAQEAQLLNTSPNELATFPHKTYNTISNFLTTVLSHATSNISVSCQDNKETEHQSDAATKYSTDQ